MKAETDKVVNLGRHAFPGGNRNGRLEHEEGVRNAGAEIAETELLGVTSGRKAGSGSPVKSLRLYEHDRANIRVMAVRRTHEKRASTRER